MVILQILTDFHKGYKLKFPLT